MAEALLPEPDEQSLARILGESASLIAALWIERRQAGCSAQGCTTGMPASAALPQEGSSLEAIPAALVQLLRDAAPFGGDPLDFAHIPSTGNPAALIADAFASAANLQSASARLSPLAVGLEQTVLRWLAQFLGYGEPCAGLLTSGSSLANLTALTAARDHALPSARERGMSGLPPARLYTSRAAHACIARAARMLGIGEAGIVDVSDASGERIDARQVHAAITADQQAGRVPVAVVATVGTTATGAVDPLEAILEVTRTEGLWLHVDGAYGAPVAAVDRSLARLLAQADSLALDLHKWLFLPYEAGVLLLREPSRLTASFSFTADYLQLTQGEEGQLEPMHLGPELSRGLRALRVWATFHWAGARQLRQAIAHNMALAERFHDAVCALSNIEACQPPGLSVVCLRLRGSLDLDSATADSLHLECIERLAHSSPAYRLSSLRRDGRLALRACFVNPRTKAKQVIDLAARLDAIACEVMGITHG